VARVAQRAVSGGASYLVLVSRASLETLEGWRGLLDWTRELSHWLNWPRLLDWPGLGNCRSGLFKDRLRKLTLLFLSCKPCLIGSKVSPSVMHISITIVASNVMLVTPSTHWIILKWLWSRNLLWSGYWLRSGHRLRSGHSLRSGHWLRSGCRLLWLNKSVWLPDLGLLLLL